MPAALAWETKSGFQRRRSGCAGQLDVLPAARHDFGQNEAMRCTDQRSALQRATQRTAFVASPFCRAHCIRYAKTIHPARCIRPFTFERPRSRIPKSRKRLKRERHCIARLHRSPSARNAHRPWPTEEGVSSFFPEQAPQKPRLRASPPAESPKDEAGRMIGPEEHFFACFRFTIIAVR